MTRRLSGKLGTYLYAIIGVDGHCEYIGLAKWEADYMMRVNNGRGRGWRKVRFTRDEPRREREEWQHG